MYPLRVRDSAAVQNVEFVSVCVVGEPSDAVSVALSHDDRCHKDLDRPDVFEGLLALARRLVESEGVSELVLRDCAGGINLVAEDEERYFLQFFDAQEGV